VPERTGVVLAGGYARRFGDGDKTLAELDGRPLVGHAVDGLRPVVEDVVVSCRTDQIDRFESVLEDVTFCPDPTPDRGPLAGLAAAIDSVDGDETALATADMPCVPSELYTELADRLNGVDAVIVTDGEFRHPAPGLYRSRPLAESVEAARARETKRLRAIFEEMRVRTVEERWVRNRWGERALIDVNTRETLQTLRSEGCGR
jgi:molybdopterin-guanine dinucleotide biosynthesis protein A